VTVTSKTEGDLITFCWPCGCSVSFTSGRPLPHFRWFFDDEGIDVWEIMERRHWAWHTEKACGRAHGGYEVRTVRDETHKPCGGRQPNVVSWAEIRAEYQQKLSYSPSHDTFEVSALAEALAQG
jgi:hypothetical protein